MSPKRIQIQKDLFELMIAYIRDHYDSEDITRYRKIISGIKAKEEALARHNAYTLYKTSSNDEKKEAARQLYLETAGIPSDYRW